MKRYFWAVGILVLLMVTMMPLASAAASGDQRFRAAAYNLSGCDDPGDGYSLCPVVDRRVGAVSWGPYYSVSGCGSDPEYDKSYSLMKLLPNTMYLGVWVRFDEGGNAVYSGSDDIVLNRYPSDENGRIKGFTNTCGADYRAYDKSRLDSGYFIGLIPLSD